MKEVSSDSQFKEELKNAGKRLVVVDFFATWCGPCKMLAPHLEQFTKDFPTVVFLKVDVDVCQDTAASQGIQAMPTINLYVSSAKVDSVRGCNPDGVKAAIQKWLNSAQVEAFPQGGGVRLGGDSTTGSAGSQAAGEDKQQVVAQLLDMGFSEFRAKKAAAESAAGSLETAMDWLIANQDRLELEEAKTLSMEVDGEDAKDGKGSTAQEASNSSVVAESEDSKTTTTIGQAKSLKSFLNTFMCGKLFKSEEEVEFHAVKSGHVDFAESTEEVKPLTEEEKKAKLVALEQKMNERKAAKAEEERRQAIEMEKKRRTQGQELAAAKQRLEQEEMRKIAEERRRQKREDALAKQRVLEQIKKDREAKAREDEKKAGAETQSPPAQATPSVAPIQPTAPKDYSKCKLQIRLTNGQALVQEFDAKESLAHVRVFVEQNRTDGSTDPVKFMTTFPRKVYSDEDMNAPLAQLGLVPSAVLIITK